MARERMELTHGELQDISTVLDRSKPGSKSVIVAREALLHMMLDHGKIHRLLKTAGIEVEGDV